MTTEPRTLPHLHRVTLLDEDITYPLDTFSGPDEIEVPVDPALRAITLQISLVVSIALLAGLAFLIHCF